MDPLGATASIITVLQLSSDVVKYIISAKGATKDRRRLRDEISACKLLLLQFQDYLDDGEEGVEGKERRDKAKALEGPIAPLHRLRTIFETLDVKLQPKQGMDRIISAVKWPFTETEVQDLVTAVEREKSLLQLAVTKDCRELVREINQRAGENGRLLEIVLQTLRDEAIENEVHFSKLTSIVVDMRDSQGELWSRADILVNDHRTSQREMILEWITDVDFGPQHSEFIHRREYGTCQWFLDSPELKVWLMTKGDTLFCPGIPGAGKSFLTSILVDALEKRYKDADVGIAYIYCDFRKRNEWRAENLLASLVKQLAQGRATPPEALKLLHKKHTKRKTRPSLNEISETLQTIAATYTRVFILVDAVDECEISDDGRTKFLTEIFSLRDASGVNIMATARNIPEITEKFDGHRTLDICAHDIDIKRYIDGTMSQLPQFVNRSAALREQIKGCIVQSAQGMFLLAQLHLDSLKGTISPKQVRNALAKLPTGSNAYDDAYQKAMERIEGQSVAQKDLAKGVLSWITCAKRPLTTSELREAIAIEAGDSSLDEDSLSDIQDIVSVCAGLVTVDDESNIIRLIHYTTQEYFERTQAHWFPNTETMITEICITYLSFSTSNGGLHDPGKTPSKQPHSLHNYAARYWAAHACLASSDSEQISRFLSSGTKILSDCLLWSATEEEEDSVRWLVERGVDVNVHDVKKKTPLHYAALNQWTRCVKLLLEHGAVLSADIKNMTPIHYGVWRSNEAIVQTFLDAGAPIDFGIDRKIWQSSSYQGQMVYEPEVASSNPQTNALHQKGLTPLHFAALIGSKRMTKFLIDHGADVNAVSEHDETPLHLALKRDLHGAISPRHVDCWNDPSCKLESSVDMIDFDPYSEEDEYSMILSQVEEHRAAVVSLLLGHNSTNTNAQDIFGTYPIHCVMYGKLAAPEIVTQLIRKGANISVPNCNGQIPLHLACFKGDVDSVSILLGHGADARDHDIHGLNALHYAVQSCNQELIHRLVESVPHSDSVAFVRSRDGHGRNILHHLLTSREFMDATLVEPLLAYEVGVNDLDDNGLSPLAKYLSHSSLFAHNFDVIRMLFENGADPSFTTSDGGLSLAHLYARTHKLGVDVLTLLADSGVDLQKHDEEGRTLLHHAGISGSLTTETLDLLCTVQGLSQDSSDVHGKTALWYAAEGRRTRHSYCFDRERWSRTERLLLGLP